MLKKWQLKKTLSDTRDFVFDVDETLYDSPVFARERKKGYLNWYVKNSGLSKNEALLSFLSGHRQGLRYNEICNSIANDFAKVQNEVLNQIEVGKFISKNDKLVDFISKLNGTRYILSDASRIGVLSTLASLGFHSPESVFQHIYTIDNFNAPKPHNLALIKIGKKHQLNPNHCLVFGDSNDFDILPAKKMGMKTVHLNVRNEKSDADFIFSSLEHFLNHAT